MVKHSNLFICTTLIFVLFASSALGSGFRIPETSIAGIGSANALVADYKELGSIPYNPANMSFLGGRNLVMGVTSLRTDIHAAPDNGTATDNKGEDSFLVPHYYYMSTLNRTWSYGLNINVPFGLETKWPAGTFKTFSDVATAVSSAAIAGLEPENSKIEMINFNPNVSFRMDNTSIAFGIDYYDISKLVFNTQAVNINGDGGELGWNIALQHVEGPLSFGLSYRSPVKVDVGGTISVASISAGATAKLEFPSILQAGARYKVNRDWALEFDIDRTGWSSFDTVTISHSLPAATGITSPITSTNNWNNANAYRFGAEYRLDANGKMRFGYSLDKTPQPDDYFSARIPDSDRQLFSVGYARKMGIWSFEVGYMYVKGKDRNITSSTSYLSNIIGGDTEANGTNAYNGTYSSTVQLLGVGFTIKL
jgi:long-chain fatty acid transport protein